MYLQATNAVGLGKPSSVIHTSTKGQSPSLADKEELITVNSTSATVFLEVWPNSGCPIINFDLVYRPQGQAQWRTLGAQVSPREEIYLSDLQPATRYFLRIAAHNDAGTTQHEYIFATRSKSGEIVPLELIPEPSVTLMAHLIMIVPVISGILCTVAVTVCVCILFRKRHYTGYKAAQTNGAKSLVELENQRNSENQQGHAYSPSPARKGDSSLSAHKGSDTSGADYEICPYATFSLPTQAIGHSMQFQTFSQRDCYEGQPRKEYHYSRSRAKASTSKSPPDGLSLEISCISSQQTLPVGRKPGNYTGVPEGASAAFLSDSDSSSGKPQNSRRHPTPAHKKHSSDSRVVELDSSTESAEASPEIDRKANSRRVVSSRSGVRVRECAPLQPPSGFSDSRELSEAECDRDRDSSGGLRLLRHEELEQQLSTLVKRYRQERDREKQDYTIHV